MIRTVIFDHLVRMEDIRTDLAAPLDLLLLGVDGVHLRLAALDLWLAEDLLRHYPRDYLDYANLVRIAALEPGRTATIVATVRRSHSFTSPRNPNLSILELQLADVTGRLKVSKFFAGKRFSSPGWLKAQQRQYPAIVQRPYQSPESLLQGDHGRRSHRVRPSCLDRPHRRAVPAAGRAPRGPCRPARAARARRACVGPRWPRGGARACSTPRHARAPLRRGMRRPAGRRPRRRDATEPTSTRHSPPNEARLR